jgi:hypothetical protein
LPDRDDAVADGDRLHVIGAAALFGAACGDDKQASGDQAACRGQPDANRPGQRARHFDETAGLPGERPLKKFDATAKRDSRERAGHAGDDGPEQHRMRLR